VEKERQEGAPAGEAGREASGAAAAVAEDSAVSAEDGAAATTLTSAAAGQPDLTLTPLASKLDMMLDLLFR
jgi:hypothetical protein